ncbi:MAG: hypothetical protein ACRDQT_02300 [Gaiellaceae bacterium]
MWFSSESSTRHPFRNTRNVSTENTSRSPGSPVVSRHPRLALCSPAATLVVVAVPSPSPRRAFEENAKPAIAAPSATRTKTVVRLTYQCSHTVRWAVRRRLDAG